MKKTINNIFDEAKPNEIENLVNKNDAPDVSADTLSSIKNKVYTQTGIAAVPRKKPFFLRWQSYVTVGAACLCLGIGVIIGMAGMKISNVQPNETLPFEDVDDKQPISTETGDIKDNTQTPDNTDSPTNTAAPGTSATPSTTDSPTTTAPQSTTNKPVVTDPPVTTNKPVNDQPNNTTSLDNVNNGVLKDASPKTMEVPENMKYLGTTQATEENNSKNIKATVVAYTLDGSIVNWATENDFIYVITEGNNRLVIIDSNKMIPVHNTPLAGVPAEMNIIGDQIYISLPDLCRIDIFSKADCKKEGSLYFDNEVSSFCLDGNYIFYTEHDQHCKVFKKNLITNQSTVLYAGNGGNSCYFYFPKIHLNKEDRILYVGESGSTGSAIYYFDADTLALKSMFKKDNYGISNHSRELFHVGDKIFWANYCLSDTNAKELIGRYGTASWGGLAFASEELVSTYEGLFLTDTYECVINYRDADFDFEHILVSDSYNVFFRKRSVDKNIIVGINFELQPTLESI